MQVSQQVSQDHQIVLAAHELLLEVPFVSPAMLKVQVAEQVSKKLPITQARQVRSISSGSEFSAF